MGSERSCAACRAKRPKEELIRFARSDHGVILDLASQAGGRGGYTCKTVECFERALSKGMLARTLRTAIPGDVAERLRNEAKEYLLTNDG